MKSTVLALLVSALCALSEGAVKPPYNPQSNQRSSARQQEQTCTLYDFTGQGGDSLQAIDYINDLYDYNFDNRASSACVYGIWILYEEYDYNIGTDSGVSFTWGENYCTDIDSVMDNRASSLRYTGAPDGYTYDTFNMYDGVFFQGDEEFTYGDLPQMNKDNLASSIIVTGCSPWTAYEYDNYQGRSQCFYPSDEVNCYPGFYPRQEDLNGMNDIISSVRRGCFSDRKVYAQPIPKDTWVRANQAEN